MLDPSDVRILPQINYRSNRSCPSEVKDSAHTIWRHPSALAPKAYLRCQSGYCRLLPPIIQPEPFSFVPMNT